MHELLFAQTLLDLVCCEAAARTGRRVEAIHLRVGELCGIEPRALLAAFEARKVGTACSAAELVIETVAVSWVCAECGRQQPADAAGRCQLGFCADCGCDRIVLATGFEIDLERVEFGSLGVPGALVPAGGRRRPGLDPPPGALGGPTRSG